MQFSSSTSRAAAGHHQSFALFLIDRIPQVRGPYFILRTPPVMVSLPPHWPSLPRVSRKAVGRAPPPPLLGKGEPFTPQPSPWKGTYLLFNSYINKGLQAFEVTSHSHKVIFPRSPVLQGVHLLFSVFSIPPVVMCAFFPRFFADFFHL